MSMSFVECRQEEPLSMTQILLKMYVNMDHLTGSRIVPIKLITLYGSLSLVFLCSTLCFFPSAWMSVQAYAAAHLYEWKLNLIVISLAGNPQKWSERWGRKNTTCGRKEILLGLARKH